MTSIVRTADDVGPVSSVAGVQVVVTGICYDADP